MSQHFFYVLLTVHLSIFILVINQLDAQNFFYNKFISCLYIFRAPCARRQEVQIVLYSLWYHHTYRCGCFILKLYIGTDSPFTGPAGLSEVRSERTELPEEEPRLFDRSAPILFTTPTSNLGS